MATRCASTCLGVWQGYMHLLIRSVNATDSRDIHMVVIVVGLTIMLFLAQLLCPVTCLVMDMQHWKCLRSSCKLYPMIKQSCVQQRQGCPCTALKMANDATSSHVLWSGYGRQQI